MMILVCVYSRAWTRFEYTCTRMTCWIALRRGSWWLRMAVEIVFKWEWLYALIRATGAISWMHSALIFTHQCGAGSNGSNQTCSLCLRTTPGARSYHTMMLSTDPARGVQAMIDSKFERPEVWMFVRLAGISDQQALAFWQKVNRKGFNQRGMWVNFLPCTRRPVGIQADNDIDVADSVLCSEMITAFLQSNGYPMNLTPCTTTPQLMLNTLLDAYPKLRTEQYIIHPTSLATQPIKDRLLPLLKTDPCIVNHRYCCEPRLSV